MSIKSFKSIIKVLAVKGTRRLRLSLLEGNFTCLVGKQEDTYKEVHYTEPLPFNRTFVTALSA